MFLCLEQITSLMPCCLRVVGLSVCALTWNLEADIFSGLAYAVDTLACTSAQDCIQQAVISVFLDNVESPYGV